MSTHRGHSTLVSWKEHLNPLVRGMSVADDVVDTIALRSSTSKVVSGVETSTSSLWDPSLSYGTKTGGLARVSPVTSMKTLLRGNWDETQRHRDRLEEVGRNLTPHTDKSMREATENLGIHWERSKPQYGTGYFSQILHSRTPFGSS